MSFYAFESEAVEQNDVSIPDGTLTAGADSKSGEA
jgi:hypothetical protein